MRQIANMAGAVAFMLAAEALYERTVGVGLPDLSCLVVGVAAVPLVDTFLDWLSRSAADA